MGQGRGVATNPEGAVLHLEDASSPTPRGGWRPLEPEAELLVLHALGQSIVGVAPLTETLTQAVAAISTLMPADRVSFLRLDLDQGVMRSMHTEGLGPEARTDEPIPLGPLKTVLQTGAPFSGPIRPEDSAWTAILHGQGLRSSLVVPLEVAGRIIGSCNITSRRPSPYTAGEMTTAVRIAALAAIAMAADDLRAVDRRRTAELLAVLRVSESVSSSLRIDRVLAGALDRCLDATGLEAGAVFLAGEETEGLELAVDHGLSGELRDALAPFGAPNAAIGAVATEARPRLIRDLGSDPGIEVDRGRAAPTPVSVVAAPLVSEDHVIGVIALVSLSSRPLERSQLSSLVALSRPVAMALGNARLYESLQRVDTARRRLLGDLVEAQERERRAIAEDIHDDTIQVLTAVGLRLHALRTHLRETNHADLLEEVQRVTRAAIDRLRSLMFELHPQGLDRNGLGKTVRTYIEQTFNRTGPTFHLDIDLRPEPSADVRAMLYRIILEALTNIRKHSDAGRVDLVIRNSDGGVLFVVRDDGSGFVSGPRADSPPRHFGITGIRQRAETAGGWCRIESDPGAGTTVTCWVPASRKEPVA
ncbi:MAG: GAF domain-containing protein [Actinomycetota bacterium]